ncbi:MAG: hypothetical protein IPJ39_02940 [Saprospiraceae bacterium]|nr:hypothetical protein [Saprospiraceae bacterium]
MQHLKLISFFVLMSYTTIYGQNVGVGTLNPLQKLHVNGDIRIDGDSLIFNNTSPTTNTSMFLIMVVDKIGSSVTITIMVLSVVWSSADH